MASALRNQVGVAAAALALIGVLFLASFPARAYLAQRAERVQLAEQAAVLEAKNHQLHQRVAELGTDAEIERLARLHHHLVRPGEEAYAILPGPSLPPVDPPPAPAPPEEQGWVERLWDRVTAVF